MTESCGNCRFWKPIPDKFAPAPGVDIGCCHRRSPIVINKEQHDYNFSGFPPVNSLNWCGEYEPVKSEAADDLEDRVKAMIRAYRACENKVPQLLTAEVIRHLEILIAPVEER